MNQVSQLKQRWKPGSIVQIDLEDGTYAYGLVLKSDVAFYDYFLKSKDLPAKLDQIQSSKIAFIICVHKYCVTQIWPIIAKIDYDKKIENAQDLWHYDSVANKYIIWKRNAGGQVPATWEECKNLEYVSVWECGAVEQRLRDYFAKRPCWYLESDKPDWKFIPIKKFYAQYGYDFTFLDDDSSTT